MFWRVQGIIKAYDLFQLEELSVLVELFGIGDYWENGRLRKHREMGGRADYWSDWSKALVFTLKIKQ